MDASSTFIIIVVVMISVFTLCACVAYWNSRSRRIRAALNSGTRVHMCNAGSGAIVKVVGVVQPTNFPLILSPIGGRPCAFYQVRVDERRHNQNNNGHHWHNVLNEEIGQDFFVSDGTGMIRVPFQLAELMAELSKGLYARSGTFNNATPNCEVLLNRHGQSSMAWIFNRTLRFSEGSLAPGDTVAILARFERDPVLPNVLIARPPTPEMKASEHKIVLCDDPAVYGTQPPLLMNQQPQSVPQKVMEQQPLLGSQPPFVPSNYQPAFFPPTQPQTQSHPQYAVPAPFGQPQAYPGQPYPGQYPPQPFAGDPYKQPLLSQPSAPTMGMPLGPPPAYGTAVGESDGR